jgi:dTDP-4-amino-4,6-dideoxygalactose transaminase
LAPAWLTAAVLLAQLTRLEEQTEIRMANAIVLDSLLWEIEGIEPLVRLPTTTRCSYHIYMFRYRSQAFAGVDKRRFVSALQAEGITGAFAGYTNPLYANPMFTEKNFLGGPWPVDAWEHGRKLNYADFAELCPVSERACAGEAVWIPQTMLLAEEKDMRDIAQAILKIQKNAKQLL